VWIALWTLACFPLVHFDFPASRPARRLLVAAAGLSVILAALQPSFVWADVRASWQRSVADPWAPTESSDGRYSVYAIIKRILVRFD